MKVWVFPFVSQILSYASFWYCIPQDTLTKGKMITDLRSFFLKYEEITGFQYLNPI